MNRNLFIHLMLILLMASSSQAIWESVNNPTGENIQMFLSDGDQIYAGCTFSQVYSSTDLGNTWKEVAGGLGEEYSPIWDMIIVDDWFFMTRDGFDFYNFRSQRVADQWQPWEAVSVQEGRISDLTAIDSTIFGVFYSGGVQRSDDYGWSWTPITVPNAQTIRKIFAADGKLFASEHEINGGTMYRSDDMGETWTEVGQGLGSSYVCSSIFWQGKLLVCVYHMGGDGTFWSSTDYGDNWEQILTLPTDDNINAMAVANDGRLTIGDSSGYAGQSIWLSSDLVEWENYNEDLNSYGASFGSLVTHDGWFFKTGGTATTRRAPQPAVTGVQNGPTMTMVSDLTAWPNPFNPRTTLSFTLELSGFVELDVFNLKGHRVAQIFNGEIDAGVHDFDWQARDAAGRPLPSGIYMARVKTGNNQSIKKLMLLE
ncbi:MAG: T9SS type A sorting domain-containing protein [bacterium]|nr:T9SS type A sorting domain-containing protein [bacterium]MCP4801087.1 T9SS type A sorting domain-containing protein [bacterium]